MSPASDYTSLIIDRGGGHPNSRQSAPPGGDVPDLELGNVDLLVPHLSDTLPGARNVVPESAGIRLAKQKRGIRGGA